MLAGLDFIQLPPDPERFLGGFQRLAVSPQFPQFDPKAVQCCGEGGAVPVATSWFDLRLPFGAGQHFREALRSGATCLEDTDRVVPFHAGAKPSDPRSAGFTTDDLRA